MGPVRYPEDIAKAVFSEVKKRNGIFPSEDILIELFEILYFASIKTEEAEPIIFNIVYLVSIRKPRLHGIYILL